MDSEHIEQLRQRLNEIHKWPSIYMFKFVIPNQEEKLTQLKTIFGESAEFRHRHSAQGNYVSVTIYEMMLNAESIFERYLAAGKIEGIISL